MNLEGVIGEVSAPVLSKEGFTFDLHRDPFSGTYRLTLIEDTHTGVYNYSGHELSEVEITSYAKTGDFKRLAEVIDKWLTEAMEKHKEQHTVTPEEVPLFTEAVVGFRKFKLADWVLGPLNYGYPWRPGENIARCLPKQDTTWGRGYQREIEGHKQVPHKDCHCGLNAFFEPHDMKEGGNVTAAVIGWGDMRVHPDGWRAEKARIVALLNNSLNLDEVARLYDVPIVVDMEALQMKASEFGTPLPASLRPKEQAGPTATFSQVLKQHSAGVIQWTTSNTSSPPRFLQPPPTSARLPAGTRNPYSVQGLYTTHRYGPAVSPAQRMDEMMAKVKEINAKNEEIKKAVNPPNPKKKPWRAKW